MDRVTKPVVYAEHAIPWFWRIEGLDAATPRLQTFRLDPSTGAYRDEDDLGPGVTGEVVGPWTVRLDMSELTSE